MIGRHNRLESTLMKEGVSQDDGYSCVRLSSINGEINILVVVRRSGYFNQLLFP